MRRRDPYEDRKGRSAVLVWLGRLVVLMVTVTVFFAAALFLFVQWQDARLNESGLGEPANADLNLLEEIYLGRYLASRVDELERPVGQGSEPVAFVVSPGEGARPIAANLADAGLLSDEELFVNYLRYHGLDSKLEAGTYRLDPRQTLAELALVLTRAEAQEVWVRFVEGWRYGEMVDYLRENLPANVDPEAFEAIVEGRAPFPRETFDFLASIPPGATLEGFLFPDTYRLPLDADAAYLVQAMLENFGERVTPRTRQMFGAQGLTIYEAVTLAAIVEREAVVASERSLIAGVFLNRLEQDILLQADPTIQYALGYQAESGTWWKRPLLEADLSLDSAYNTYLFPGLPPGPIANPSLSSLQAAAEPSDTAFLFFVADCSGQSPGTHVFSSTYEEHLANVQRCR